MIIGHKKNIYFLEKQVENNSLSQAYIFEGPEMVGKKTTALFLAEKVLRRKIKEIDPAVFVFSTVEKEIKLETTKELIHKMSFSSNGRKNIFIVDEAEKMNKSSQNALLKSIEEMGENKIIIFITSDKDAILPTIRSRCQRIKFGLVNDKEIEDFFVQKGGKREVINFWSEGRPGVAEKISSGEEGTEKIKEAFLNFRLIFGNSLKDKFDLAKNISKDQQKLFHQMEIWVMLLRKFVLGKDKKTISKEKAFFLLEETVKSLKTLKKTRANSRIVLEELFLKF